MTLLTICTDAASDIGLEALSTVASSSNRTARRLLSAANRSLKSLGRRHAWQAATAEHTFVTVAAEEQSDDPLPDDYDRIIPETMFNRTRNRELFGPLTKREWQAIKAGPVSAGATDSFYIRGNVWLLTPAPAAGQTIAYEYVSSYMVDSGPTPDGILDAARFGHDLDECALDEEMMTLDIIWRYKKSAGLPYAEDFRSAELMIADRIAHDGAGKRRTRLLNQRTLRRNPLSPTIPEGNWTP